MGNGLTIAKAQLTELDLSDNAFGPIGVSGLANLLSSPSCYQLQELKLNNNGLGISGGKMLAEALLRCHKNSTKKGKSFALKLLVIGRNRLENEGATALAEVFNVRFRFKYLVKFFFFSNWWALPFSFFKTTFTNHKWVIIRT